MKVEQNLANYRTLLIELLVKIRIKAPASLHNLTIGEMFAHMDWEGRGGAMQGHRHLLSEGLIVGLLNRK